MTEHRSPEEETPLPTHSIGMPERAVTGPWRMLRPLGNRDFRVLFSAVVLSVFAAGMWAVVMVYSVIGAGGGPLDLSLVAAANAVGLLLCAVPGGIVADRVSRRLIVRLVELLNLVAITSVVVTGWFGVVTIPHLAIVAFALGAGAGFFFPAYSAMLPRILPPEQLLAANGLEGAIRPALQQAAGPAVAGVIVAAVMVPTHAALAIAIAHGCALVLLLFQGPEPVLASEEPSDTTKSVFHDLKEAVQFTVKTPWLLWTLLYASGWVLVFIGPDEVLLPFITRERIGVDPRWFGFLLAVYGLGGVLGSIVVSSRPLPRRYLTVMNLVWGLCTLPYVLIGVTDQYWVMLAVVFVCGFGFSFGNVIWGTLLQRRVPTHMLGRISSLDFFVSLALMPLSMALAGPVAEVVPIPVIFLFAGVLPLLFGIVAIIVAKMPQDEIAHPLDR
ncbi:tetracycline efflux MFS transporter Tet(V) [Microbacterium deminutum]|uniref:Tetracycline efflux MFS transporter Tet(V) n=2 Tax=Microbacterium deminutum TaxID=344164 RepID=A0ABN2Q8A5_9MICO